MGWKGVRRGVVVMAVCDQWQGWRECVCCLFFACLGME